MQQAMSRIPRRHRPSALDGYSRLARTGTVVASSSEPSTPDLRDSVAQRRRRRGGWRFAGGLRFLGLAAVLVLIVGASVGLASADPRGARTSTAAATHEKTTPVVRDAVDAIDSIETRAAAEKPKDPTATERVASTTVASAVPEADAIVAPANAQLPVTGDRTIEMFVLAGATLVLMGMALQIAGQPLPARARARRSA
ncbi:MAG: hypothetical protein JWM90_2493 [Thermoleophilia bacterium]|nr:hypothetical protein [Thermoleophilia bacterium]